MSCSVVIVGVPVAATCAPEKTWRAAADVVAARLRARFGSEVAVEYLELFSDDLARRPEVEAVMASDDALPPVVLIDGERLSAGDKLNLSAIERAVAARLGDPVATHA